MFRFGTPEFLYLLILILALVSVYVFAARNRRARLERFGQCKTISALMPEVSLRRQTCKFVFFLLAIFFLILALARPQLGSKLREVKREGIELMLAVDVSNSMLAQDMSPSRLDRTKYAIERLLEELDQDRVGLTVFAGDAYVQLPITSDYVTARNVVSQISPSMISKQGTAIGAAISVASSAFTSASGDSRAIVLITDGENHEDDAMAQAQLAAEQGIRIYTIGIGTPEGAPIQIDNDFIRDDSGEIVVSRLDEKILQDIALHTGGAYIRAGNQSMGLREIVDQINATEKAELTASVFEEYDEQFQYFLAIALVMLIVSEAILPRKNRLMAHFDIFKGEQRDLRF